MNSRMKKYLGVLIFLGSIFFSTLSVLSNPNYVDAGSRCCDASGGQCGTATSNGCSECLPNPQYQHKNPAQCHPDGKDACIDQNGNPIPNCITCGDGQVVNTCAHPDDGGTTTPTTTPQPTTAPDARTCGQSCTSDGQCITGLVCRAAWDGVQRCVHPANTNDQTCRQLPACNSVCNTNQGCGSSLHTVQVQNIPTTTANGSTTSTFIDYVLDDNIRYEDNSIGYFTYSPLTSWARNTRYTGASGGGFARGIGNATVTFSTTSTVVYLGTYSGTLDILGDGLGTFYTGQLKYRVDNGAWITRDPGNFGRGFASRIPITVETSPAGYICYNDNGTSYCRLPSDPENEQCTLGADISVIKTTSNQNPAIGENITFTITVTNNGPITATNVIVEDILPSNLQYVSSSAQAGSYSSSTGRWSIPSLSNGASTTLTITAKVVADSQSTINKACVVASDQPDSNTSSNCGEVTVDVKGPNLTIAKVASDTTPANGNEITFTVRVTNSGDASATNIVVQDLLPNGLAYVRSQTTSGSYSSSTGIWSIASVGINQSVELQITARVTQGGTLQNTACITSTNTCDTETVTVVPLSDLSVIKTAISPAQGDTVTVQVGDNAKFEIKVTNGGPDTSPSVVVSDVFTSNLMQYVSSSTTQGNYDASLNVWNVGSLASGASAILTLEVKIIAAGNGENVVTVKDDNSEDPDPSDNTDTVPVNGVECINCNYQVYSFWGALLQSFVGGVRYEAQSSTGVTRVLASTTDKGVAGHPACTLSPATQTTDPGVPLTVPSCADPVGNGILESQIDTSKVNGGQGYAEVFITNNSNLCTYTVGAASYKAAWTNNSVSYATSAELEAENLYDYKDKIALGPNSSAIVRVKVPFSGDNQMCYGEIPGTEIDTNSDLEGCTIGYWKNHPEGWVSSSFTPTQSVQSVFEIPTQFSFGNDTLMQALFYDGGPELQDKAMLLVKQAVAAVINADLQNYGLTTQEVIDMVNYALASGDAQTMEVYKNFFDDLNNMHNSPICGN